MPSIANLTLSATAADVEPTDLLPLVNDANGTPVTKKLTYGELRLRLGLPVTLRDFGGVADARQVSDAAMTASSAVLTSATAAFTSADVGKAIRVSGAGAAGAKLSTTILSRQSATQVTLSAAAGTTVSAKGATFGTDSGPALQLALDALSTSVGGTLVIDGSYLIGTAASENFGTAGAASVRIIGQGASSRLYIGVGATVDAITIANLTQLTIDGVQFVGTPNELDDAKISLKFSTCQMVTIRDCGFYGLACVNSANTGVVVADSCDLRLRRCYFGGTVGNSANGNAVVYCVNWVGFSANECQWIDYGTLGTYTHSKTPLSASLAWVKLDTVAGGGPVNARSQGVARMVDCQLDEGAIWGFLVSPTSGRVRHVHVQGVEQNVAASGKGLYLRNIDYLTVRDSWHGYASASTPDGVYVDSCTNVTFENVETAGTADRLNFFFATNVSLTRCKSGTLTVNTSTIVTERDCTITTRTLTSVTSYNRVASGLGGVIALTKAGAISDSDFTVAPPIGTLALDTTNLKLYAKTAAATWKSSAAFA